MGQCLGACFKEVPVEAYERNIRKIKSFLNGNVSQIKRELTAKMNDAAAKLEFERAAEIRDQIRYVEMTVEKQKLFQTTIRQGTCSTSSWTKDGFRFKSFSSGKHV